MLSHAERTGVSAHAVSSRLASDRAARRRRSSKCIALASSRVFGSGSSFAFLLPNLNALILRN